MIILRLNGYINQYIESKIYYGRSQKSLIYYCAMKTHPLLWLSMILLQFPNHLCSQCWFIISFLPHHYIWMSCPGTVMWPPLFPADLETKDWPNLFLQDLDAVQGTGDKKLTELRTLGEKVSLSTSERGGKALKATVASMEDAWNQHIAKVGELKG